MALRVVGPAPEEAPPPGDEYGPEGSERTPPPSDLNASEVRIILTDPPRYEITFPGGLMTCSPGDLAAPAKFATRYLACLHRFPEMPAGKGALSRWARIVNEWLENAQRVHQSPEAGERAYQQQAVKEAIDRMNVGEKGNEADLTRGLILWHAPKAHLKLSALRGLLRHEFPSMRPDDLCEHLRALGWASPSSVRCRTRSVRSWSAERRTFARMRWAAQCTDEEETEQPPPPAEPPPEPPEEAFIPESDGVLF